VWATLPEKMNYQWVGDRVAHVDVEQIQRSIRTQTDNVSWGPNRVFQFPLHGGTGDIWNRIAHEAQNTIHYQKTVVSIDVRSKTVTFQDGSTDTYDVLLSTMPLDDLQNSLIGAQIPPPQGALQYSDVTVIGIGVQGSVPSQLQTKCWMYFPEPAQPFFRATVFSNYSPHNSLPHSWSLMCETATSSYIQKSQKEIYTQTIEGAKKAHLISRSDIIIDTFQYFAEKAYPTPTLERDVYIEKTLPLLETYSIYSRGRFGVWKYEVGNMDHSFMQGVEWVNRMIGNEDEVTIHKSNIVNAPGVRHR
jgi:protoporphyrinogen oxidase